MELFNQNCINIVEISSGNKPLSLGNCEESAQDNATIDKLYQSTVLMPASKNFFLNKEFELAYANAKDINQIIKSPNVNKAKGPDGISAKFLKMLADVIVILQVLKIQIFLIISFLKMLKLLL